MNADVLTALSEWYLSHCDGDWEHQRGIRINTLDNPGWSVEINLAGTALENSKFEEVGWEKSTDDWTRCRVENSKFRAWGGPNNLVHMLTVFLEWKSRK